MPGRFHDCLQRYDAGYCGSHGTEPDMTHGYAYDHAWPMERVRLDITAEELPGGFEVVHARQARE